MLISHRHKFIYTKTVKTAGTSVESFFERFCMPNGEWTQQHARDEYESSFGVIGYREPGRTQNTKWWNHMSALQIRKQVGQDIWDSYYKFCVVRNPFDKCISAFCHFCENHRIEKHSRPEGNERNMSPKQFRFLDYLRQATPIDRDKYLIDKQFCLDDVIRYESLESDLRRVCHKIGVPFEKEYLPTLKMGKRGPDATIEALYTKEARELVEERFLFELNYFGYGFPSPGV